MSIFPVSPSMKLAAFTLVLITSLLPFNARSVTLDSRACFVDGQKAAGDLEKGQQNVLSRFGKFDYESMQYRFEALSLWGGQTQEPDITCFRYEIKNLSGQKLEAVRWPVARLPFVDIRKNDRVRWLTPRFPSSPVGEDLTEVWAFKISSDFVRAYVPLTPALAGPHPRFGEFDIQDSMPEAVKALDEAKLPSRRLTTVGREVILNQKSFLRNELSNGTLHFEYFSAAAFVDRSVKLEQGIKFFAKQSETEVSDPYLSALDTLPSPVDSTAVSNFATAITKTRSQWKKPTDGSLLKFVSAPVGDGVPALFIVQYPVTVRTQNEMFCVVVTAYSVVPVEAAANYCAPQQ